MAGFINNNIAHAILSNGKRVAKITRNNAGRDQACKYVVAECATQKVKLTEDEIVTLGCQIFMAL